MIICNCHCVRHDEIVRLVESHGLQTLEDLASQTPAGQSCGGCVGNLISLLEAAQCRAADVDQKSHLDSGTFRMRRD